MKGFIPSQSRATFIALGLVLGVTLSSGVYAWKLRALKQELAAKRKILPLPSTTRVTNHKRHAGTVTQMEKNSATQSLPMAAKMRESGEFILDTDIVTIRERLEQQANKAMEANLELRRETYLDLFEQYGITDPATQEQLLKQLGMIYRAKMQAGQYATSLASAQYEWDVRMRKLLGEKYEDYVAYESGTRARFETQLISEFAESSDSVKLSDAELDQIESLVHANHAYSQKTLGFLAGPFDPIAMPTSGRFVVPALEERVAALSANANTVMEQARAAGMSANQIELLQRYFAQQLDSYAQQISDARTPSARSIRHLEERLAKLRTDPVANAASIAETESMLHTVRTTPPMSWR